MEFLTSLVGLFSLRDDDGTKPKNIKGTIDGVPRGIFFPEKVRMCEIRDLQIALGMKECFPLTADMCGPRG